MKAVLKDESSSIKLLKNDLNGKVVYVIPTGARRAAQIVSLVRELVAEKAQVVVIPTKSSLNFINLQEFKSIENCSISLDFRWSSKSNEHKIPEEDIVLVVPCTFNTFNKISLGIADTYPTSIIASAVAKRKMVYVALSVNELWYHPQAKKSLEILSSWENVKVVWPEITEEKVRMVDMGKILDIAYMENARIRFDSEQLLDNNYISILCKARGNYFKEFVRIGTLQKKEGTNSYTCGCNSVRVNKDWMLITASGSDLSKINSKDLTLVKMNNNDKVLWVGDYLPSSETPLHLLYYRSSEEINAVVHGHCTKMTYDFNLAQYATPTYIRYGRFDNLESAVNQTLNQDGFIILKLHGEVGLGKDLEEAYLKISRIYKKLLDAPIKG